MQVVAQPDLVGSDPAAGRPHLQQVCIPRDVWSEPTGLCFHTAGDSVTSEKISASRNCGRSLQSGRHTSVRSIRWFARRRPTCAGRAGRVFVSTGEVFFTMVWRF